MNLEKVFKFIKEKRGYDYPVVFKILNGIPLNDDELTVNGNLSLRDRNIESLPDNLMVRGWLDLRKSKIHSLPNNLRVDCSLDLSHSNIKSLPDNLTVGFDLRLGYTDIATLPNNLKVYGDLWLYDTPLSEKYSKEEIRKMIEDKGGYIKGTIFI